MMTAPRSGDQMRDGHSVPVPDPTALTTEQLYRAIGQTRELFDQQLLVIETRISAIDRATELLHNDLIQLPSSSDRQITHLRELVTEQFSSIEKQFTERDVRTEQAAIATKIAVDAALQAQKEAANAQNDSNTKAVEKSETATTKQIDGISALLRATADALNDKITDLKGRLDRGEGSTQGSGAARTERRLDAGLIIAIAAACLAAFATVGPLLRAAPATSPVIYAPAPAAPVR